MELNERSLRNTDTPATESDYKKTTDYRKGDQQGVTGGIVQDSNVANVVNGQMVTNHVNGNTIINVTLDDGAAWYITPTFSRQNGLELTDRHTIDETPDHQYVKTATGLFMLPRPPELKGQGYLSTKSLLPTDQDVKTKVTGDTVDRSSKHIHTSEPDVETDVQGRIGDSRLKCDQMTGQDVKLEASDSPPSKCVEKANVSETKISGNTQDSATRDTDHKTESGAKVQVDEAPAEVMNSIKFTDGNEASQPSDLGIRGRLQCEKPDPDISLNRDLERSQTQVEDIPITWRHDLNPDEEWIFDINLTKIIFIRRLITQQNVRTTIHIGHLCPEATFRVRKYLKKLYFSVTPSSRRDRTDLEDFKHTSGNVMVFNVDLTKIKCLVIRSKTRQNLEKIVFLAEVSPEQSEEVSDFLDDVIFQLARTVPVKTSKDVP